MGMVYLPLPMLLHACGEWMEAASSCRVDHMFDMRVSLLLFHQRMLIIISLLWIFSLLNMSQVTSLLISTTTSIKINDHLSCKVTSSIDPNHPFQFITCSILRPFMRPGYQELELYLSEQDLLSPRTVYSQVVSFVCFNRDEYCCSPMKNNLIMGIMSLITNTSSLTLPYKSMIPDSLLCWNTMTGVCKITSKKRESIILTTASTIITMKYSRYSIKASDLDSMSR